MTLRQPTERHGGNAGIDEEAGIMVSNAIASLDAWLAQAEAVLEEQHRHSLSPSWTEGWQERRSVVTVTLASFKDGLTEVLGELCRRPGRWVLICHVVGTGNRFWQAQAYEDGSLIVEAVSNVFLEEVEQLSPEDMALLARLGWDAPEPPERPNWRTVEATTSPDISVVVQQALLTLRLVYRVESDGCLGVTTFDLADRGATPASELITNGGHEIKVIEPRSVQPFFLPTTEPWAHYYRFLYPGHEHPRTAFSSWKYATTRDQHCESAWLSWRLQTLERLGSWKDGRQHQSGTRLS
jgi:hypothetical protein